jgi:hypothetical protein
VSNSTTSPASNTIILSLSMTVCSLCAIVITVQSENCLRIVVWIRLSVLKENRWINLNNGERRPQTLCQCLP